MLWVCVYIQASAWMESNELSLVRSLSDAIMMQLKLNWHLYHGNFSITEYLKRSISLSINPQ